MNTTPSQPAGARPRRRWHSDEFKADLVAACMQPGISIATVAMAIRIELQRGATAVTVTWPASEASECAAWMRELLR